MENNLDNLQEDEVIIEDIDVDALQTLDETLEQDITEAKVKKEECDCEDEDEMDEMDEATKVDPKSIDGKDNDDKEDDGEGLDDLGDEDSDVDNDGDSDEADEYLTKRRKTIAKKIAKEETNMDEDLQLDEADDSNKIIKVEIPYLSDERNDRDIEMHKVTKKAKASADKNGFKITKVDDAGEEIYVTFSGPKSKLLKFVRQHMGPSNKNDTDEELLDTFGESFESEDTDLTEATKTSPWKFRLDYMDRNNLKLIQTYAPGSQSKSGKYKNQFDDSTWQDDLNKFGNEIQNGKLPPKAVAAKVPYMIHIGYGNIVIYGNSPEEIKKYIKEYDSWSKNMKEDTQLEITVDSSDISRLIESEEGLTEEFKDKAAIIFEAAVSSKVNEIEATLVEQYESRLAEEVESVKSVLEEQVDSYLTYAVESWMEENKVAVESSLRTQLAENFISALKTVFVENYVDVPDSKVDLFAQLEAENNNLKEESAKFSRIAESLADRVDTLVREQIVTEASAGLADTQVDRLKKLVEDIEFVDAATYRKKVATIKEFYLNGSQETEDTTLTEETGDSFISTETIVEGESMNDDLSPEMKSYLTALSRMSKATTADLL